ncbi:MAG: Fic family protein [Candidatus Nanopelagicales bacterium]|nr:Fic family protein [Candidatus Nanopelagicales bacterium]MCF8536408.1 Fic family protein [Candidatus Nanopelagicales bacterium]MCF8541511.1 Fic family protein [Candidatus Nanopelagicales bacterium]MCF8558265.1 Fic family protein [Candidatus Nanopelagicales bacterium]
MMTPETHLQVANARAALASLDSTARQLPNAQLFRYPTLRYEAQSTSALEGTYAPLSEVLLADEDDEPTGDMREILNYVAAAEQSFAWQHDGRPVTPAMLSELQRSLVNRTRSDSDEAGHIRDQQVVIGRGSGPHPVESARFVPHPGGDELRRRVQELTDWMSQDHARRIDPVVKAGMVHYQFETLHPFNDGNGRIGRLLIVLELLSLGVLSEPTLSVSPWFEQRRTEYYDRLLGVSTHSSWDAWLGFFANGLEQSARATRTQMLDLVAVQSELHDAVRASTLRADSAHAVVDYALARPTFTVRALERDLNLSYGRANKLVLQLTEIGVLELAPGRNAYRRRFRAPAVMRVLLKSPSS